jgi:metal-responsive CopG/Arc/MetJ family transcriptional regulator
MAHPAPEDSQVVSVRLPTTLVQRLDRVLDWHTTHRRRPTTRNAALREA